MPDAFMGLQQRRGAKEQDMTTATTQSSATPLAVTDADFQSQVLESDRPVLVDFGAPWCGPCRVLGPVIEELAAEYGDAVTVAEVNVDDNPQTAQAYGIASIPTVVLFHGGDVVTSLVGALPKSKYQHALNTLIAVA